MVNAQYISANFGVTGSFVNQFTFTMQRKDPTGRPWPQHSYSPSGDVHMHDSNEEELEDGYFEGKRAHCLPRSLILILSLQKTATAVVAIATNSDLIMRSRPLASASHLLWLSLHLPSSMRNLLRVVRLHPDYPTRRLTHRPDPHSPPHMSTLRVQSQLHLHRPPASCILSSEHRRRLHRQVDLHTRDFTRIHNSTLLHRLEPLHRVVNSWSLERIGEPVAFTLQGRHKQHTLAPYRQCAKLDRTSP